MLKSLLRLIQTNVNLRIETELNKMLIDRCAVKLNLTWDLFDLICLSFPIFVALEWNVTEMRQVHLNLTYILSTDKRTDVWSRDFIIWKINSGLWAVVWDGLWNKRVWANYEQLLRPVFQSFYGQKTNLIFFWKYIRVRTEKLHRIKVDKNIWKVSFMGEKQVFLGLKI